MSRSFKITSSWHVERGGEDLEVELAARFWPGTADVRYLRNGDPGYPGDPATVDNVEATIDGVEIALTPDEMRDARERLIERGEVDGDDEEGDRDE